MNNSIIISYHEGNYEALANSASLLLSVDVSELKTNIHVETLDDILETKHTKLGVTYVSQNFSESPIFLRGLIIFKHLYSATFNLMHRFFSDYFYLPTPVIYFGYICFYIFQDHLFFFSSTVFQTDV